MTVLMTVAWKAADMRVMFVGYLAVVLGGLVFFLIVGLLQR